MSTAVESDVLRPPRHRSEALHPSELGMWAFLATVTMLFAAFVSSYLIRRASADWVPVVLPTLLWWNSVVLVSSSLVLEGGRHALGRSGHRAARQWLLGSLLLGGTFVAGQAVVWRQLVAQGVFIPSSPHSSFLYLLTGLHVLHVVAGLALMASVLHRLRHNRPEEGPRLLRIVAAYWHYMGGLWIFLFLVLARL